MTVSTSIPRLLLRRLSIPSSKHFSSSPTHWIQRDDDRSFTNTPSPSPPRPLMIPNSPIKVFHSIPPLRTWRRKQLLDHRSLSLVPTMGALHSGHLSLIRAAARHSNVIISIYVNPSQFGTSDDLSTYPRTWEQDSKMLRDLDRELADAGDNFGRIAAVFAPGNEDMYPSGFPSQEVDGPGSFVSITPLGNLLEGKSRPTFFRGVATVCMKLFNIVQPDKVYFGQKDIQQVAVIKKMVKDFRMDAEVVACETVREPDGLAMSSRNVYLGSRRRKVGTVLNESLLAASRVFFSGVRTRSQIIGAANELCQRVLDEQGKLDRQQRSLFEVDYLSLADPETMEELDVVDDRKGAVLSGAIKMLPLEEAVAGEDVGAEGGPAVRLIDNRILKPVSG